MNDVQALRSVVQNNCDISDARHARNYTLCVYLLKMREFFRWEKGYALTQRLPMDQVGSWVVEREALWEQVEPREFECVPVGGGCADPFDAQGINEAILPRGLVYSAGYGRFVKPHFFLGSLLRRERRDGFQVLVSRDEYARDLSAPPAMLQGSTIYVRRESVRRMLWEQVEEWRWRRCPANAMARATAAHDFESDPDSALEAMTDQELDAVILHELGEGMAGERLGAQWQETMLGLACSRAEMPARAARDLLADSLVTLPELIEAGAEPSLHFYFANFKGSRRDLFPALVQAYEQWAGGGSLQALQDTALAGREHWERTALSIMDLAGQAEEDAPAAVAEYIESRRKS